VAEARIRQAENDLPEALQLLDEAERVFFADFSPVVTPIPALKARLWIAQGRSERARDWARTAQTSTDDDVGYVGQFEHSTLARLLLADDRVDEALALTERLIRAAENRGWVGAALDALVVQALARHARRDVNGALESLARAFTYSEPEGYVRIFADEGRPMAAHGRSFVVLSSDPSSRAKRGIYFGRGRTPDEKIPRFARDDGRVTP